MGIARDAWLAALDAATSEPPVPDDPHVLTTMELAEVMGKGIAAATRAAKILVDSGKAERTTKMIRQVDGRWRQVPAYRLVATPEHINPQSV